MHFNGNFEKAGTHPGILEIPIASKPKQLFEVPTRFKLKRYRYRSVEDRGWLIHTNTQISLMDKMHQFLASRMLTVDNHTFSSEYMLDILKHNVRAYRSYDEIFISLIGHPKSMGDYAFELLGGFVNRSREIYKDSINFCTFRDIYQRGIHKSYDKKC